MAVVCVFTKHSTPARTCKLLVYAVDMSGAEACQRIEGGNSWKARTTLYPIVVGEEHQRRVNIVYWVKAIKQHSQGAKGPLGVTLRVIMGNKNH